MEKNIAKKIDTERIGDRVRIYLRGNTWYANFQHERRQHRLSLETSSKKQARTLAIRLEADLAAGRYEEQVKAVGISTAIEAYVKYLKTEGRARKTLQKVELVMHRVRTLAEARDCESLLDIDLSFVDAYRAELARQGRAQKTLLNQTVIIRQLINFALQRQMIRKDPLQGLKLRKVKSRPQPCWSRDEVKRIIAAASGVYHDTMLLLAETGMRVGEAKWLTWDDIDFVNGVILIRPKDDWRPKSGDQRSVPMSPAVKSLLAQRSRQGRWVLVAKKKRESDDDRQIAERLLLVYLKRLLQKMGLAGHVHTFRHSFISHAIISGIPEAVVRQWVGHVDREILDHYTHIADRTSATAMTRLFDDSPVAPPGQEPRDGKGVPAPQTD